MSVFIDGSTLSSLLYSHSNSAGNQEGLLLGQVIDHVKDHISDSQINNSQVQTCMYVSSHIPWPNEDRVYSRGGVPIMEKLAALLGDSHRKEEVVGWYSFRRNSTLRMSMKERTLHKHLETRFCPHKPDHFLFFMCADTVSAECTTHSMDHFFVTVAKASGGVKKISMTVSNLGDTLHTQYKTLANMSVTNSSAVKSILRKFQSQFVSQSEQMAEVKRIDDLSSTLNNDLMKLCKQVAESEHKAGELEMEVEGMREELAKREDKRREAERRIMEAERQKVEAERQKVEAERQKVEAEQQKLDAENKKDSGGFYPHFPPQERVGYGLGQERLVVDLRQGSGEQWQGAASVDDLLSGSITSNLCDSHLHPIIPSTLDEPPPPYCAVPSTQASESGAPVLQSVVDTIEDTDEDEVLGAGSHGNPLEKVPAKGKLGLNNVSKAGGDGASKTGAGAGEGGKSQDHFSFVENMITSESGTSQKKTAIVPTGATVTYSPRTTRSQLKGHAGSTNVSAREQSKQNNTRENAQSAFSADVSSSSPKPSENSSKVGSSSSLPTVGNTSVHSPNTQTRSDRHGGEPEDKINRDSSKQGRSGGDSNTRLKLDPNKFDLDGRQRSRSQITASSSKRNAKNTADHERASSGSRENGSTTNIEDVDKNMCRSSSPVF
ncbi:BRISC complex subunit Abraxas 2-like [Littorina saxatilis]|uniref:Uncharacterized protein n=1 Tax=Littorina saxatilis TaxID=31220 RepID=A0AAN9BRC6_9CAEN